MIPRIEAGDTVCLKAGKRVPGTSHMVDDEYPTLTGTVVKVSASGNFLLIGGSESGENWWLPSEQIVDNKPRFANKRYGHPRFYELLEEFADLHSRKNKDYAHGGKPTGNFDRVARILSRYPGLDISRTPVVALVYMMKQLDAVLWSLAQGYDTDVESRHDKMRDIAVYATLAIVLEEEERQNDNQTK